MEQASEEKEFAKTQARCLKLWKTLILGLRIRQRVNAAYTGAAREDAGDGASQVSFEKPARLGIC
jgi:xeroderma pigmentosum group C-complementing protein